MPASCRGTPATAAGQHHEGHIHAEGPFRFPPATVRAGQWHSTAWHEAAERGLTAELLAEPDADDRVALALLRPARCRRAHNIDTICLYQARYGYLTTWLVDDLVAELAGRPVHLGDLRSEWSELLHNGFVARPSSGRSVGRRPGRQNRKLDGHGVDDPPLDGHSVVLDLQGAHGPAQVLRGAASRCPPHRRNHFTGFEVPGWRGPGRRATRAAGQEGPRHDARARGSLARARLRGWWRRRLLGRQAWGSSGGAGRASTRSPAGSRLPHPAGPR